MTHTIVLIDQNSARRFERTTELHRLGFKVRGVPDGSLAAVMAAGESVDAYLVDEDSGGFDLCFALKTDPKTWAVPVVLLASLATALKKPPSVHGPDHILATPMRSEYLASEIVNVLEGKNQAGDLPIPVPAPARVG